MKKEKLPHFIFVIDSSYDINWVQNLLKNNKKWSSRTGSDTWGRAIYEVPSLKDAKSMEPKKAKVLIKKEILAKYKELKDELIESKKSIEKEWQKIEGKYFREVKKLFDDCEVPTNEFKAILSILQSFPYHKEENSVHVPYVELNNLSRIGVLMHENLHLIFFHFCKKRIKKKINELVLWNLSEIINPIIQNREPYLTMCKFKSHPHPAVLEQYIYLDSIFDKRKSMQSFIEESIKYLEKFDKEHLPYEERAKLDSPPILVRHEIIEGPKLLLEFNKGMQRNFCVFVKENIHDIMDAKWINPKTLIVPLKNFEKNKEYVVHLNMKEHMYFKTFAGKPLEPVTIKIKIN